MKKKKNKEVEIEYHVEVDKTIFISSIVVIVLICAFCIIFPKQALVAVEVARKFVVTRFDWLFMLLGIGTLLVSLFFALSRYGKIRLSDSDEKPEFGFFSWLFMIYFSAIGSSTLLWAICEPMEYLIKPPFGIEPFSERAYEYCISYGMFHWGPIAWAFFAFGGLVVSYCFYIKKKKRLQLSSVLSDVIGEKRAKGFLGKTIDVLSIFFTFCTFGPSLGFGVPTLTGLIAYLFNIPQTTTLQMLVLIIWCAIFTTSVYKGLTRGIKVLSDVNMWLLAALITLVFVVSDPLYILRSIVEQSGEMISSFVKMSCYTSPLLGDTFAQDWTVYYWIWWIVEIPFMGIFIARVSKGRSIRQLILGIIGAGSLGTMSVFWVLGNYAVKLQHSGKLDLAEIYAEQGSTQTVISVMTSLPFAKGISVVMILLFFVFLATCIDSGSFTMGCIASRDIQDGQQPKRWNRATWAICIALLGVAVLRLGGGLNAIKTIVIVAGLPAAVLLLLMGRAIFKWIREDFPQVKGIYPKKRIEEEKETETEADG